MESQPLPPRLLWHTQLQQEGEEEKQGSRRGRETGEGCFGGCIFVKFNRLIFFHGSKEIKLYLEWPCGSVGSHPATGRLPLKRTSFILFPTSVFILHSFWRFSFLVFPNSIGCVSILLKPFETFVVSGPSKFDDERCI